MKISKRFKKLFAVLGVIAVMCCMLVPFASASSGNGASEAVSAVKEGFSEVTGTISIGNIVSVLAIVLAVAVGFFFFWWGIRKVIKVVSKSFKSGKISV